MAIEIERKFLLASSQWREHIQQSLHIRQGYLAVSPVAEASSSVRVRISGHQANLNIKGMTLGIERAEYEYPIPLADGQAMLDGLCMGPILDKHRHIVMHGDHRWEIDEFHGDNAGLIVAEIELGHADERFEYPPWLGDEVSDDPRYYNVLLAQTPFSQWPDREALCECAARVEA